METKSSDLTLRYGANLEFKTDICPPFGSQEHSKLRSEKAEIYEPLRCIENYKR